MSRLISRRAEAIDASGIRKVFDLAARMKDPINLSIGLPDFDVPEPGKQAAIRAIESGHNRYTQTQGIASLRERLRADLSREMGKDVGEVLITSGVSGALLLAILSVIDPGDEAIFLDPYFVMYKHLITMAGGKSVIVDSYPDFGFPADRVEQAVTPKTKMLILNSPSNPTGMVMTPQQIEQAVRIARKHNLLILSDEIYEPFLYDVSRENRVYSPLSLYDNTLVVRGFSKSYAMTGWRVGYACGPAEIISQMTKLQQYTFVCAPSPFQEGALAALDVDMSRSVESYRRKRDLVYSKLSQKFEIQKPGGAFYIFPKVPDGMSASAFVEQAIANNVLIIPGNVFSERDTHFRISYATTDDKLLQGCDILLSLV
ncbi:MAG: aminotransferase [Phycisphaerae bacterium]|jgi:aspartate aminotransferase/aminotransferase|nr:MAG: aminotransferase [Phycisphaerae bacterium]